MDPNGSVLIIFRRRAIVPIGVMFSMSLIFGNVAYMYLSVSFIQMLKVSNSVLSNRLFTDSIQATNSVATLLATWIFGLAPPNMKTLANVSTIVIGVAIASYGEIKFDLTGFLGMLHLIIVYRNY